MRNLLVGIVVGLIFGATSSWAYNYFLGDHVALADAQHDLTEAKTSLEKKTALIKEVKDENETVSAQVKQLVATNEKLKSQVTIAAATPAPDVKPAFPMAGFMRAGMAQQREQRLLLLKARLHLTPEQEATLKAAMEEESARNEQAALAMFSGKKFDPQAFKQMGDHQSVDKMLDGLLTPDQKKDYDQLKADQKQSAAENAASSEVNQVAPLLQLSDDQKDKVYNAIYQNQINGQDLSWIKQNASAMNGSDPAAALEARAKAKEDALSKVLTPEQLQIYHQQAQSQVEMQKAFLQRMQTGTSAASAPTPTTSTSPSP